jgi:capsular polysaccharide biosynthesis protein
MIYFHIIFFIINNKKYFHDFEFKPVMDFFKNIDNIKMEEHIDLLNNKDFTILELDKVIFIKYVHTNAGHVFGNLMNTIYKLKNIDLSDYKIIITEDFINFSSFLTSIIYLFYDKNQVIIINDKTLVTFNETFVIKDNSHTYEESSNYLIEKLKLKLLELQLKPLLKENIFLIKTLKTKNQNSVNKCFNHEYNDYFIEKGFNMIIPETYDIISLFNIIYNAKNIIMSWGCCAYLNSTFVNENANVLVIAHIGYENEYINVRDNYSGGIFNTGWFPNKCNKKQIAYCKTELDDNIILELNKCISNMI